MTATITTLPVHSPVDSESRRKIDIHSGDIVRVHQKIEEGGKTRTQMFEGMVIARKHGSEPGATFTVRRVASGIGVEKIFPLHSPNIEKIEIIRRSKVRKSKLYYIREKVSREIKHQMRRMRIMNESTTDYEQEDKPDTSESATVDERIVAEATEQKKTPAVIAIETKDIAGDEEAKEKTE